MSSEPLDFTLSGAESPPRDEGIGISTGLRDLDALTGGLLPGTLTVLSGPREAANRALTLNILAHAAVENGVHSLLVDDGTWPPDAFYVLVACRWGVALDWLLAPCMSQDHCCEQYDYEKVVIRAPWARCQDEDVWLREPKANVLPEDSLKCLEVKLIVISSLLALHVPGVEGVGAGKTRVADAMRRLKAMARDHGVAVLAAHPLRADTCGVPTQDFPVLNGRELEQEGLLEAGIDNALFLDGVSGPDVPGRRKCGSVHVGRLCVVRSAGGATGTTEIKFEPRCARFSDTKTLQGRQIDRFEDAFARFLSSSEGTASQGRDSAGSETNERPVPDAELPDPSSPPSREPGEEG